MRSARQKLEENLSDIDGIVLIADEAFRESLVGVTWDMRAVYDYDKMVREYAKYYYCSLTDAKEYIEHNIVGSLPMLGDKAPIVMDTLL